jgi:transposase-like protein
MKHPCPYCQSKTTHPFARVAEKIMEYICEACGCTFNVEE